MPASEAAVLKLGHGGTATLVEHAADGDAIPFTREVERGLLMLGDHPGWDVRSVNELTYELDGGRLTTDWIDGGSRRVFEREQQRPPARS